MQLALALLALAGYALAIPLVEVHPTFSRSENSDASGQHDTSILTSDGAAYHNVGTLVQGRDGTLYLKQVGTVTYTAPNGQAVYLSFVADEDGYRASGTDVHGAGQQ